MFKDAVVGRCYFHSRSLLTYFHSRSLFTLTHFHSRSLLTHGRSLLTRTPARPREIKPCSTFSKTLVQACRTASAAAPWTSSRCTSCSNPSRCRMCSPYRMCSPCSSYFEVHQLLESIKVNMYVCSLYRMCFLYRMCSLCTSYSNPSR